MSCIIGLKADLVVSRLLEEHLSAFYNYAVLVGDCYRGWSASWRRLRSGMDCAAKEKESGNDSIKTPKTPHKFTATGFIIVGAGSGDLLLGGLVALLDPRVSASKS